MESIWLVQSNAYPVCVYIYTYIFTYLLIDTGENKCTLSHVKREAFGHTPKDLPQPQLVTELGL